MIHIEQHGPVIAIRMARSFFRRPLYWTAAYWIDGLLIDCGPRCTERALLRVLEQFPVQQIVLTHTHEDHIGGLGAVHQHYPDAPIFASRHGLDTISDPSNLKQQLYRRLLWGIPRGVDSVASLDETSDRISTPDFAFRVIETPGHSRDHIILFEPDQRWVFCGDAFIGGIDHSWPREYDMFGILGSLWTLTSLRPQRLFPGSGHVRRTPLPEIHEKIGSLMQLCKEVARLDASGMSVTEMVETIFHGESNFRWWTGGHFSGENLINACRTYNALTAAEPGRPAPRSRTRRTRPSATADSTGSSTNRPTDRGDVVR